MEEMEVMVCVMEVLELAMNSSMCVEDMEEANNLLVSLVI